jgi:hypothetical protein
LLALTINNLLTNYGGYQLKEESHLELHLLNLKLKESNNLRESDILINEIIMLDSILGRLADLKYGNRVRAMEIAETSHDFRRAIWLREQLNNIQDLESEISAQIQN